MPPRIPDEEIELTPILSSGPGGQNVNKVATAIQLRFDARRSPSLDDRTSIALQRLAGQRLTRDGVIVITARRFRSQERNRADAIERLLDLVAQASHREPKRIPTRPGKGARERRLTGKAHRARVKQGRGGRIDTD
ncbi:peptidyl-tRNA hydrolase domain protein [Ameyamaea chiangmaiensis NBRC 103196]|nr:peptidyl-tRNA hydrolase domain protein [Ameyamaea chiangmaiensis NBRC 103196]